MTRTLLVILLAVLAADLRAQPQTVAIPAMRDNTLYFDPSGGLSNGAGIYMFSGLNLTSNVRRCLVAFDLAAAVPAGSTITSVQLQLAMTQSIAGPVTISAHRVLAPWGEGTSYANDGQGGGAPATPGDATWLHRYWPTAFWVTPGGDFDPQPSAATIVDTSGGYLFGSTTALVVEAQGFLDTPATNYGWLLKSPETTAPSAKRFTAREHPTPSSRPSLLVTFVPPALASVASVGAGCAGSSGLPFTLSAIGLPVLGNANFGISAAAGPATQPSWLFLSASALQAPIPLTPSCSIHLELVSAGELFIAGLSPIGPLFLGPTGTHLLPVPLVNLPSLSGATIAVQSLANDPSAPGGLVTSNALVLVFGS